MNIKAYAVVHKDDPDDIFATCLPFEESKEMAEWHIRHDNEYGSENLMVREMTIILTNPSPSQ